jgi:hypothetical protein
MIDIRVEMNVKELDADLVALEKDLVRHIQDHGIDTPTRAVVLHGPDLVRMDDIVNAMRFYRREGM